MRQKIKPLFCFLLLFISINVMGNTKTVTYTVDSKTSVIASGDIPFGSSYSYKQTDKITCQITANGFAKLDLTGFENKTITGITLSMKSNKNAGAGSLTVTCGDFTLASIPNNDFSSPYWHKAYTNSYTDIKPTVSPYTVGANEIIKISIDATINSLYCQSYTITYEDQSSVVGIPTFSLKSGQYIGAQTVTLGLPKDGTATSVQYTMDGSDPADFNNNPAIITADKDIFITSTTTVKAVAVNSEKQYSSVVSRDYNIIIPIKTVRAALAGTYEKKVFAMSAEDLSPVEVHSVNGKIINADESTQAQLSWNIYEISDSAIISNDSEQYLTGADVLSLTLKSTIFKWAINTENKSWQNFNRTFIYSPSSDGIFNNYLTSNIKQKGYQSDWTKCYTFAKGYVRSKLIDNQLATICLPYSVSASDFKGANLFEIAGVVKATADMSIDDITGIAIKPVEELTAGKPYLMQATESEIVAAFSGEPVSESVAATALVGNISGEKITVAPSDDTHWNYVLSGNRLHKITGTGKAEIANNRAYFNLYGVPVYVDKDSAAKVIYINNNTTDIKNISASYNNNNVYRQNGVKVSSENLPKGVYIKSGRKYIVK
jgi:hypothetical protein